MPTGTIKKLVADKGFGFIKTQDGKDIFFHHSVVADQGFDNLSEGQKVEFSIEQGSDKGKGPRAGSVTPA
jgi:CspA family cold shock protein